MARVPGQAASAARGARALLGGLVRCAGCGSLMIAIRPEKPRWPHTSYRCHLHRTVCPAPALARADELEPLVDSDPLAGAGRREPGKGAIASARESARRGEGRARGLPEPAGSGHPPGAEVSKRALKSRQARIAQCFGEPARVERAGQEPRCDVAELRQRWTELRWQRRSQVVRELIDCVVVERGVEPLRERALVFRRGRGPTERGAAIEAAAIVEKRASRRPAFRVRPERRIAAGAAPLLEGRESRPAYREFLVAGLSRLSAQVWAWGGPQFWAHKFEREVPEGFVRWTDKRVEDGLRALLGDRRCRASARSWRRAWASCTRR